MIEHIENSEFTRHPSWMPYGACVGSTTPDLWYPETGQSAEPAKGICASCVVRAPCLRYALEHEEHGTWGGLTANERKRSRKGAA